MPLTRPRHAMRLALSVDRAHDAVGVGLVVHAKTRRKRAGAVVLEASERLDAGLGDFEAAAFLFALHTALRAELSTVEVGMTTPFARVLQKHLRAGTNTGRAAVDEVLELARDFRSLYFRWLPRRRTSRARWLATRASGVAARRRERTAEEFGDHEWFADDEVAADSDAWRIRPRAADSELGAEAEGTRWEMHGENEDPCPTPGPARGGGRRPLLVEKDV